MKKVIVTMLLVALVAAGSSLKAQNMQEESLGLPGDNLNLYAVMKLFRESETLEGFEKSLNEENSRINNLDLNGDNLIDYIRVIDNVDGNDHTIVLQVPLNEKESQDVAVFTVERNNDGKVFIQLIGDEDLYGKNYIIEPVYDDVAETPNPGYQGYNNSGARRVTVVRTTAYEVAAWPVVRFIYLPTYSIWHSSWYWGYYPSYWRPWKPFYWHYYNGFHSNWNDYYYGHFHRNNYYRDSHWNDYYYIGKRVHSTTININIQKGVYKTTYSRPESRRDGEADYVKLNPSGNRRASESSVERSNSSRRSGSESSDGQVRSSTNTRRSEGSESTRASSERSNTQGVSTRRSSGNTSRSSGQSAIERSSSSTPKGESTSPRSTAGSSKSSGSTSVRRGEVPARPSTSGTSSRRSSGSSKPASVSKESKSKSESKTSKSETTKPTRR